MMSNYLYALGQVDERLRILTVTIRRWAEANRLTSPHPGRWITNFTLTILVVYFMQHKNLLPPLSKLSQETQTRREIPNSSTNLDELLIEFFAFYSSFNYKNHAISVIDGKIYSKPDFASLYIENPVETDLNIARNLSAEELDRVVNAMKGAVWILEGAEKDRNSSGILNLFKEISVADRKALNVDSLFRMDGDESRRTGAEKTSKKYQPDEFVVETGAKRREGGETNSVKKRTQPMLSERGTNTGNRRPKYGQEKPMWNRW